MLEPWKLPRESILDSYSNGEFIRKKIIPKNETFYSEESGFGVYWCKDENENCFPIKGTFISPLAIGQTYLIEGKVDTYKNEKQINVTAIKNVKPKTKEGIVAYLQTLKGLKTRAKLIYNKFGDESIEILKTNPLKVAKEIKGIGEKSVLKWQKQLLEMEDSEETISTLLTFGLSMKQARKLYDEYGDKIVEKIEDNPYFLAREVKGYGFERCDRIAREIGYNIKSQYRIQEGIIFVLEKASQDGHCYLPVDKLVEKSIDLLNVRLSIPEMIELSKEKEEFIKYNIGGNQEYIVNRYGIITKLRSYKKANKWTKNNKELRYPVVQFEEDEIKKEIKSLQLQKAIEIENDKVYLKSLYDAEIMTAYYIKEILENERDINVNIDIEEELNKYCKHQNIELEDMQRRAVLDFAKTLGGLCVLNGSAGCGKTFTLKIILQMIEKQFKKQGKKAEVMILAPTGKASKVASKSTGRKCMTIHRGLGYHPKFGFEYNARNKLSVDVVVVDEASMLDIVLARNLFAAIPKTAKVILIGDTNQLPAVGAGNVLKDIIKSNKAKVITLNVVKRQGAESGIIKNANKIINKEKIYSCLDTKDAYIVEKETPQEVQKIIIKSIKRLLEKGYSLEDIQVLCPQKTGVIGTSYLNFLLQKVFNPIEYKYKVLNKTLKLKLSPSDKEPTILKLYFKKGDKVIHIKNDYDIYWRRKTANGYEKIENEFGITNGECGIIEEIFEGKNKDGEKEIYIAVKYDVDRYILYTKEDVENLEHAYALTIHKSQGSEWRAVIIPIMYQNYIMLENSLFYTAYTRAEEFNIVVGQDKAIKHAIKTTKSKNRYTALKQRLIE